MTLQLWPTLQRLTLALGVSACLSTATHAAIIVGRFDPPFGNGFGGLGWSGEIKLDVPDACLQTSGVNADCDGTTVTDAFVKLYNLSDPSDYEILSFNTSDLHMDFVYDLGADNTYHQSISVANGMVSGVSLMPSSFNWAQPQGTLDTSDVHPGYANYLYGLSIDGSTASLSAYYVGAWPSGYPQTGSPDPVFGCEYDGDYAMCTSENTPTVTYEPENPVPEPGTASLLLGAVGAAAWVRRRRPRRA